VDNYLQGPVIALVQMGPDHSRRRWGRSSGVARGGGEADELGCRSWGASRHFFIHF